ncbi:hypothetical protein PAPYR_1418 [Paratrimastix pyriformis]|uniref:Uncharacterized protein n=1 Tax=Paratrimastix pyriformis TaxID=342808 RepID=A0ABQ8UV21_9EUKA|nr:hypothetical protein PAPYR_1418 [Paratrimastix pyriformis]
MAEARISSYEIPLGTVYLVRNPGEENTRATIRIRPPPETIVRRVGLSYCCGWAAGGLLGTLEGAHYARGLPLRAMVSSVVMGAVSRGHWCSTRFAWAGVMHSLVDSAAQSIVQTLLSPLAPPTINVPIITLQRQSSPSPAQQPLRLPSPHQITEDSSAKVSPFCSLLRLWGWTLKDQLSRIHVTHFALPTLEQGPANTTEGVYPEDPAAARLWPTRSIIRRGAQAFQPKTMAETIRTEGRICRSVLVRTFPAALSTPPTAAPLESPLPRGQLAAWFGPSSKRSTVPSPPLPARLPLINISTEAVGMGLASAFVGYHVVPYGMGTQRTRWLLSLGGGVLGMYSQLRGEEICRRELERLQATSGVRVATSQPALETE